MRNSSLFFAHPTYWNKCMTSKNEQCLTRGRFWILKISRKVRVLKQTQSALFGSITNITILFAFTWYQSIQAFVTSLGPFCYGTCELIYWPQKISGRPILAKYKHFRTVWEDTSDSSPTDFRLFFRVVVIDAWSRYFVELLSRLVCQLTISFHTLLCMTSHVITPWRNTKILREW